MSKTIIEYNARRLDVEQLKKVATQGIKIQVDSTALHNPHPAIENTTLVVAASGKDRYDVLLGSWKDGANTAILLSKPIIKKAEVLGNDQLPYVNNEAGLSNEQFNQLRDRYSRPRAGAYNAGARRW